MNASLNSTFVFLQPTDQRNSYEDDLLLQNPRPPPPLPAGSRPTGATPSAPGSSPAPASTSLPATSTSSVVGGEEPAAADSSNAADSSSSSTHDFYQNITVASSAAATAAPPASLSGVYNPELDMTKEYMAAMNSSPQLLRLQQPSQQMQFNNMLKSQQQFPMLMMSMPPFGHHPQQHHQAQHHFQQAQMNPNWKNNRQDHHQQQHLLQQLPEFDRRTLRCTGIPSYVTEDMIREHFGSFGYIVELQVSPMSAQDSGAPNDPTKKVYNECLVQFLSAANAKKCYNSPAPVLNNRFIKLFYSHFNIKMPSDIRIPDYEAALEHDRMLLAKEIHPNVSAASAGQKRKKQLNIYIDGVASSKYRRSSDSTGTATASGLVSGNSEVTNSGTQEEKSAVVSSSSEGGDSQQPVKVVQLSEEKLLMKKKLEELKQLKQQAENIWKRKEELLQVVQNTYMEEILRLLSNV